MEEEEEFQTRKKQSGPRKNPTRKCAGRSNLVKILEEDANDSDGSSRSKQQTRRDRAKKTDNDYEPDDEVDDQPEYKPRPTASRRGARKISESSGEESGESQSSASSSSGRPRRKAAALAEPVQTRYSLRARK